jgi:hypothetical protein
MLRLRLRGAVPPHPLAIMVWWLNTGNFTFCRTVESQVLVRKLGLITPRNSPSLEANSHSAGQEIPRLLWNPKFYYCVHSIPPLVLTVSQMHPVHTFPPYFPKIQSNIILPSTPRPSEWSLLFRLTNKNCVWISLLSHVCYMPLPSHSPWFDHPNNIWWSV